MLKMSGVGGLALGLGATMGASTLSACASSQRDNGIPSDFRVAVVGGGLAGLHCAWRLAEAGINVVVLESSNRLGGRTYTARGINADDQLCELGGELIDTEHQAMHLLAAEFGLTLDDRVTTLAHPGDRFWIGGSEIEHAVILEQFQIYAPKMLQAMTGADSSDATFDELDAMSLRAWLDTHVDKITHPELYAVLEAAYRGEYGLEIDEQSALNLIYLIGSDDASTFRVFGTSDERYHLHEGSEAVATELAKRLAGQILLEHTVSAAQRLSAESIQLTIETQHSRFVERFDRVIFAVPFTRMRRMDLAGLGLSAEKLKVINELGYGTNTKTMGSFTSRVWELTHQSDGALLSDAPFQQTWDTSRGQSGAHGVLTNFLGGHEGVDVLLTDREQWFAGYVVAEADKVFAGLKAAYVPGSSLRMHWPSHVHTLGSYACYKPGQWAFAGIEGARHENIHFCGEHTSLDFQGFMEGAAESGAFAAFEVLEDFDLPPSPGHAAILKAKGKLVA
jgi:monoamine oxidase